MFKKTNILLIRGNVLHKVIVLYVEGVCASICSKISSVLLGLNIYSKLTLFMRNKGG